MIARSWDGVTDARHADEYVSYLERTGVTDCVSTPGNRGVYVLRRLDGDRAAFRFVSLWDSMDAVRGFAGPDPERARYYPEDTGYLLALEPGVTHYDVMVAPGGSDRSEGRALADELAAMWEGEAWHGPALADVLKGVTAEEAAARGIPEAHTIWELVLHVAAWADVLRRRLEGERVGDPEEGDFPPVPPPTVEAWSRAQARLRAAHAALVERVASLVRERLDAPLAGYGYSARHLVHGAIRHIVYHTAQIALLKRAAAGRRGAS